MSSICLIFIGIKTALLGSIWAIVPLIYGIGLYGKPENTGDIILNCAPISFFYF